MATGAKGVPGLLIICEPILAILYKIIGEGGPMASHPIHPTCTNYSDPMTDPLKSALRGHVLYVDRHVHAVRL